MTRFDTIMGELGRPLLTEQLGETVTYVEAGEPDVTATAIVGSVSLEEREDDDGDLMLRRERTVTIGIDQVADPGTHAKISIGGEVWSIVSIERRTAALTTVRVSRPAAAAVSRKGIRRAR